MTTPSNTVTTLVNVGQRESLSDMIYRVSPEETPFFSMIKKGKAKARYEEWQTESLRTAVATNYALEGDEIGTLVAGNQPARVGSYCQIWKESGGVSRTTDLVDTAGRKSETARQKAIKGLEIKRDVEMSILSNTASRNEAGANARVTAGIQAWLETNVDRGAGGSDGGFSSGIVAVSTAGTSRTFTEAQIKSVMASAFSNGAKLSTCFVSPSHKQVFSGFTGIADIRSEVRGQNQAMIHAAADVYVSDFGAVSIVPHAYAVSSAAILVTPSAASMQVLDGFKTKEMGATGDANKFLMTYEACFKVDNEKSHGIVQALS